MGDAYLSWQAVRRCVSQGSVLGPIFFNILFSDFFLHKVKFHMYADDRQSNDCMGLQSCQS